MSTERIVALAVEQVVQDGPPISLSAIATRAGVRTPALYALRLIRAAAEGYIGLEAAGGFGETTDVESSWEALVNAVSPAAARA